MPVSSAARFAGYAEELCDGNVLAADEAFCIVNSVGGVQGSLVLGGLADEAVSLGEGDDRRGNAVSLVVSNDLHTAVDVHADTLAAQQSISGVTPSLQGHGQRMRSRS